MGNIEIKYAEVERPIVGIELGDPEISKVELLFEYFSNDIDGGISRCKEYIKKKQDSRVFYLGVTSDCRCACAVLDIAQMEALEKAIHSMVASIKGE